MALEDIIHRIQKEAQQAAESIMAEANKQAESIVAHAQKQADELKQDLWQGIKQRVEEEKQRKIITQRLQCQKQLLREKEVQLGNAFSGAMEYLSNLDDANYRNAIHKLLLTAVKPDASTTEAASVQPSEAVVCVNKERRQLVNEVLKEVNDRIGSKLHLSPQDAPIRGGFILQYGRQGLNCSLEAMLHQTREEITHDVAKILGLTGLRSLTSQTGQTRQTPQTWSSSND